MRKYLILLLLLSAIFCQAQDKNKIKTILENYCNAWKGKQELVLENDIVVNLEIKSNESCFFNIRFTTDGKATLSEGTSSNFYLTYKTDIATLDKLYSGQWNPLTAIAKAKANDIAPLDVQTNPALGFNPLVAKILFGITAGFFNTDWPQKLHVGEKNSRFTHGANAVLIMYQPGLRYGWLQLKNGMHANKEDDLKINEFSSIFTFTKGQGTAIFDGKKIIVKAGESYLIPAGMTHEFWVEGNEELEGFLVAFGEGA